MEDGVQDKACDGSQGGIRHPDSVHPKPIECLHIPDFVMLSFLLNCFAMPGRGWPRSGSRAHRPRQKPVTPAARVPCAFTSVLPINVVTGV